MRILFPALSCLALLAACHKAPPPPESLAGPIPVQICAEVKKSLDALSANGGFEINDKGEATIESTAWFAMTADQRDGIARALAFHAGCVSGRQSKDQEVRIHGEDGTLLTHRFVSTRTDLQSALGGGGRDTAR
ncbi:MAG TPA: hypothetical protein VH331_08035 [Allosphingosinicella sp.]|jgi:hypothetical protein|nr:hypothetical protein [Allosphingosinicella sp.]